MNNSIWIGIHIAYITVVHPIGMRTAAGEYDFYKQTKQQKISMYDLVYTHTYIILYDLVV